MNINSFCLISNKEDIINDLKTRMTLGKILIFVKVTPI